MLDASFGRGGTVTVTVAGTPTIAAKVAVQTDGKIVVATNTPTGALTIVRLHDTGSVDTGFGNRGVASLAFPNFFAAAHDLAVQGDGKLLVVGQIVQSGVRHAPGQALIARFNADGSLDSNFGGAGSVLIAIPPQPSRDNASGVLVQGDGKILVGGLSADNFGGIRGQFVLQLHTDGSFDSRFGSNGIAMVPANNGGPDAMALQDDGKIIVVSFAGPPFLFSVTPVATRLLANGALDDSTAPGMVLASTAGSALAENGGLGTFAIQPDSRYLIGITRDVLSGGTHDEELTLRRFTLADQRDRSFASPLIDFTGSLHANVADQPYALAVQPDGKVVVAGRNLGPRQNVSIQTFGLARVNPNGSLDGGFGNGGVMTTAFPGHDAHADALALQADGKIVAAGISNGQTLVLVRYLGQ
jgi:uncharacterized delta-60 repeat protein